MEQDERLERYADLAVRVGANVEAGQLVSVVGLVEHAPLMRATARAAWKAGARYVDVAYRDNHVNRAMIELAPEEALTWTPEWSLERMRRFGDEHGAMVFISGDPEPELLDGLPGERVGKAACRAHARGAAAPRREARQLDGRRVPERGLGADRVR